MTAACGFPAIVNGRDSTFDGVRARMTFPTERTLEYRAYRAKATYVRQWGKLYADIMPVREQYSSPVCAWITDAGEPNEVSHLWAYSSLEERAQVRGRVAADPKWQAFLKEGGPLLEEMTSTIALPAEHSPLK
jgi:hypothetical protein